ncbi:MAG TPA: hypothetical protein VGA88_07085 [Burkholderiales bacterium]
MYRWHRWPALILLSAWVLQATAQGAIDFKGYYKNLLVDSRTSFPLEEDYTLDLNRLRIEARGRAAAWAGFEVQYDHETFLGSFLDTAQFQQLKAARPASYWNLEDDYLDRGSVFARHRLHRGFATLNAPVADFLIGRQRVAWGSGRFWNPTDLLNPFNPIAVEREERPGVDAVLVQRNLGPLSRLSLAYAPQRDTPSSRGVHYRTNVASTDVALLLGEFRGDRVAGIDMVGRIGEGGLRLEAARTERGAGVDFSRAVAGFDYAFANTLVLSIEYYYNGEGTKEQGQYDFARLQAGSIQNVARRYIGVQALYDITPLLRSDNALIVNSDDGSRFFSPRLVYSVASNVDAAIGVQLFGGHVGSEYAAFHDAYFGYVQWFF